jgi:hypothetical protein
LGGADGVEEGVAVEAPDGDEEVAVLAGAVFEGGDAGAVDAESDVEVGVVGEAGDELGEGGFGGGDAVLAVGEGEEHGAAGVEDEEDAGLGEGEGCERQQCEPGQRGA